MLKIKEIKMKNKINELAQKNSADNILFTGKAETFYLSAAEFDGFWILALKDEIYALCSKMTQNQVKEFFSGQDVKIYAGDSLSKSVVEILKEKRVCVLTVDSKYMSASDFLLIKSRLEAENISLFVKHAITDAIRIVKSAAEIEKLKKACSIVSEVCDQIREEVKPGLCELDIHYRILELFAKNKVKESFTPIVAAGKNSANPHHASSNYKISQNDIIMTDIGCIYEGYCSDLTRTYFLGNINGVQKTVWDTVKNAQSAAINEIKAGRPICQADAAARKIIEAAGYKDNFIHTTGHGVGIEIHEMPSLAANAEGVFLTHMAVTVEPGIYIEGKFGVRIEDTVCVTQSGCEILTSAKY
ncbi:MAG: M24 family metallopeptidase [Endomicrobium sp.]|jgi:Xaa-Pro aminopeptidase|nr:M24 family metallopeptidase [Endomicrobium sp.]